ncbi:MAG: pyruvate kinase alpha/beta domain-containing protein [Syntrophaceticus schinkii]
MYWEKKGPANTEAVSKLAIQRARELKINHIVVASNSGATAEQFFDQGLEIICVTHHVGFMSPGDDEMPSETRQKLSEKGVQILTTTHLMAGLDRALRIKFGGVYPCGDHCPDTAHAGPRGYSVCVEISGMALDAGLIPYGREIIAVGGSGTGADTALVITLAHSNNFFDTKIKEIICKPREF